MNQQKYSSRNYKMRYPSIFPETRTAWEGTRNKINDALDPLFDSKIFPLIQGIAEKVSSLRRGAIIKK